MDAMGAAIVFITIFRREHSSVAKHMLCNACKRSQVQTPASPVKRRARKASVGDLREFLPFKETMWVRLAKGLTQ